MSENYFIAVLNTSGYNRLQSIESNAMEMYINNL